MTETCNDVLKISHELPIVTPSQDDEFSLVELKENEIRKTHDKYSYNPLFSKMISILVCKFWNLMK